MIPLKRCSHESVLFFSVCMVLSGYVISLTIDENIKRFNRHGDVEVYLEKVKPEPVVIPQKRKFAVLIDSGEKVSFSRKELVCLATNIYQEAKTENHIGKIAVANITYNRLLSGRWGNDICSVVYAKSQFSWTLSKKLREEIPKGRGWDKSLVAAKNFMNGERVSYLQDSQFYHADYIDKPKWARVMKEKVKIGKHIFYVQNEE